MYRVLRLQNKYYINYIYFFTNIHGHTKVVVPPTFAISIPTRGDCIFLLFRLWSIHVRSGLS